MTASIEQIIKVPLEHMDWIIGRFQKNSKFINLQFQGMFNLEKKKVL